MCVVQLKGSVNIYTTDFITNKVRMERGLGGMVKYFQVVVGEKRGPGNSLWAGFK